MRAVFGDAYAAAYDSFYARKNYEREVDVIESFLSHHSHRPVASILDLGCGTGTHALALARRGYEVTGLDRSEAMLTTARRKAGNARNPSFISGDIREAALQRRYDAVLMMFAVLSYQVQDEDVNAVLSRVREHLVGEGLFIFDVWYAPAVLGLGPSTRSSEYQTPSGLVRRTASGSLEPSGNICRVEIRLEQASTGEKVGEEVHRMRFFHPDELSESLAAHQLRLLDLRSFPQTDKQPDNESWNVLAVAKAC